MRKVSLDLASVDSGELAYEDYDDLLSELVRRTPGATEPGEIDARGRY